MSSRQKPRDGTFHNGYDLIGYPFVQCTCGQAGHNCRCNADKEDGKYKHPQKMIYSTVPGTVVHAGWQESNHAKGYGLYVCVKSSIPGQTNYYHYFAHLCEIASDIKSGSVVKVGTFLGIEGSTGHSTGSHVHYEIRRKTKKPYGYSDPNFVSLEEFTGIPNVQKVYYQDLRKAGDYTPIISEEYGVYIGEKFYTAHVFDGGKWKRVVPAVCNGSKWVKCGKDTS